MAVVVLFTILIGIYDRVKLNISQFFCLIASLSFLQLGAGCILDCI